MKPQLSILEKSWKNHLPTPSVLLCSNPTQTGLCSNPFLCQHPPAPTPTPAVTSLLLGRPSCTVHLTGSRAFGAYSESWCSPRPRPEEHATILGVGIGGSAAGGLMLLEASHSEEYSKLCSFPHERVPKPVIPCHTPKNCCLPVRSTRKARPAQPMPSPFAAPVASPSMMGCQLLSWRSPLKRRHVPLQLPKSSNDVRSLR